MVTLPYRFYRGKGNITVSAIGMKDVHYVVIPGHNVAVKMGMGYPINRRTYSGRIRYTEEVVAYK